MKTKTEVNVLSLEAFAYIVKNTTGSTRAERAARAEQLVVEIAEMRKRIAGGKVVSLDDYRRVGYEKKARNITLSLGKTDLA